MPKPANHIDLRGQQFGLLLAMEPAPPRKWHCACACGAHVEVLTANLRQNRRQCSAGCPERSSARAKYMAQMEIENAAGADLALTARTLILDEMAPALRELTKRDRAAFFETLQHRVNLAIGP